MNVGLSGTALRQAHARTFDITPALTPRQTRTQDRASTRSFPLIAASVRRDFLDAESGEDRSLILEAVREAFFREQVPYGDIIFREARKNGLPPELVAALVHTESDFRRGYVSDKNAQGLMQIVPSTARLLGVTDPFDPEQNIAAGARYHRYLLDRFGTQTMALAARHAGAGNVDRFGGVPPFADTVNYIAQVNRRTDRYRQRVHNTSSALLRISAVSEKAAGK